MPKKKSTPISVTSLKHSDKRANIPTEELHDFVKEDEKAPKTLLYPRDPSLDPQLVWKGKDEQDRQPLEVPAVPIYIQEKISPQAIVENVRANAQARDGENGISETQLQLFADFNHIPFEQLVEFYQHEQAWSNRMILGDSLLVMASLAEKERLKGQVQMIYMDPPYGIKFGSNWQVSTKKRDVQDSKNVDITIQPEQVKAFRDTWELGIHSYLTYLRDRLFCARELLNKSGSIFVQIGDENIHLIRNILDEVFGSENFIALIPFRKKNMPLGAKTIENMCDYLLWYAKDSEGIKYRPLFRYIDNESIEWRFAELSDGQRKKVSEINTLEKNTEIRLFTTVSQLAPSFSEASVYDFSFEGKVFIPPNGACWLVSKDKMERLTKSFRLQVDGRLPRYILFFDDFPYQKITNPWLDVGGAINKVYVVQTNPNVIERCMLMTTDPGDLVLDPTCGSGTTAFVAEQWGRRWITIDTSRVAVALARTRLMAARYPYYYLSDSPEGQLKQSELAGHVPQQPLPQTYNDVRHGFVYKRVPHITLKSIANNEEIDTIYEKFQQELESLRKKLNELLKKSWEKWEIPRELEEKDAKAIELHAKWWQLRRERQAEIDASIARRADVELLYDQPYEDNKKVRVSGPFTVESLSPHRVLPSEQERPLSEQAAEGQGGEAQFELLILEHLRKYGVQAVRKGEHLTFTRLEPFANEYLQAMGEYQDAQGNLKRAAVCIGPEHGTVGPDLVKEAAKEAVKGRGADLLVVLGFAFDPHVSEEAREFGPLTVLPARINPELQMGGALLKKSGAANMFMAFGEPDMKLERQEDGKYTVSIRGVDVYDPNTGEIRSSSPDEIACWFIDSNYNGESFFVRHAYFTGGNNPYDKLKRALRAEIDEAAWSALYATTSYPFEKPKTGKVAVKVINHYGDEVMKVVEIK